MAVHSRSSMERLNWPNLHSVRGISAISELIRDFSPQMFSKQPLPGRLSLLNPVWSLHRGAVPIWRYREALSLGTRCPETRILHHLESVSRGSGSMCLSLCSCSPMTTFESACSICISAWSKRLSHPLLSAYYYASAQSHRPSIRRIYHPCHLLNLCKM